MTLTLYNTLTRRKEPFEPLDPGNVRIYVCGPTVYDDAHIGNARPVIVFDVLFRLLRHIYGAGHVTYARNITDVDDKINTRAAAQGVPIRELTERTTKQFHEDIAALRVLPATVEPRATEHIDDMKRMIETLAAKGHAYVAEEHVLFHVPTMADYGRLANRSLAELEAGARVEVAPYKKDPMDFVLWKPSKEGEPAWPSPCGIAAPGRPGWHIECSAMADRWLWHEARARLSEEGLARPHVFDIHGGGIDLVFPHHENEIAQSRCAHGTPVMAQFWMHNGFLQVEGQKMAKSVGNFVTIRELLDKWGGEVLRFNMLKSHYRQPIDWTSRSLEETRRFLLDLERELGGIELSAIEPDHDVIESLSDDLNTPLAIAAIHKLRTTRKAVLKATLHFLGFELKEESLLGRKEHRLRIEPASLDVVGQDVDLIVGTLAVTEEPDTLHATARVISREKVEALLAARNAARKAKNFKEADRIRNELAAMGVTLKDGKDPETGELETTWEVKR